MKMYQVTAGTVRYTMAADSITHAMNFVRHWPNVRVRLLTVRS